MLKVEILQGNNYYKQSQKTGKNWEKYFQFISSRVHFLAEGGRPHVKGIVSKESRKAEDRQEE